MFATMAASMLSSSPVFGSLSSLKCDTCQSCIGYSTEKTRVAWQMRSRRRTNQAVRISAEISSNAVGGGESSPPKIHITFVSHKMEENPRNVSVGSGEKQLRKLMLEEKVPLYDAYGTMMNCGGAGNCATCLVEILEGSELLSGRTDAELKQLKKRPESWRLACQTILGDKTNAGEVVVQCLPQKVKK